MDVVMLLVQLAFGLLVKHWPPLAAWPNRLIPLFNLALAVLAKLGQVSLAHADTGGLETHAHPGWWAVWCFLKPVIATTLASTGIFSSVKNVQQHLAASTPPRTH